MKRHSVFLVTILYTLLLSSCNQEIPRYIISLSRCSDNEWRTQMNKEIRHEVLFYSGVEADIRSANDDNQKQTRNRRQSRHTAPSFRKNTTSSKPPTDKRAFNKL